MLANAVTMEEDYNIDTWRKVMDLWYGIHLNFIDTLPNRMAELKK